MPLTDKEIVTLQSTLAHRRGKCKECGGSGTFVSKGPAGPYDSECGKCGGSGEVYLLGDVIRVPCPNREWRIDRSRGSEEATFQEHPSECYYCHEGTAASTRQEDWEKACMEKGWTIEIKNNKRNGRTVRLWLPAKQEGGLLRFFDSDDPDPKAALIGAIEKAVGKEKGG